MLDVFNFNSIFFLFSSNAFVTNEQQITLQPLPRSFFAEYQVLYLCLIKSFLDNSFNVARFLHWPISALTVFNVMLLNWLTEMLKKNETTNHFWKILVLWIWSKLKYFLMYLPNIFLFEQWMKGPTSRC